MNNFPRYDSYKDSGVSWLGEIPSHWSSVPLFTVATLKSITNCPERELLSVYLEKGVIRFSDVDEKRTNATSQDLSAYQAVEPGDFVLNNQQAWRGSVGVSNYKGIVSPAYLVLTLSQLNTKFANYLFRDGTMVSHYLVCSKGVGTIQRNLYWSQLKRVNIAFPPLSEQTAIAEFLDRKTAQIEQAIAKKDRLIELLKERRQILIYKAVTRGLNPHVKMKHSGVDWIGEIPEHWEVGKLKYLFTETDLRTTTGKEILLSLRMHIGLVPHDDVSDKEITDENLIGYRKVNRGQMVMNRMRASIGLFGIAYQDGLVSPDYAIYEPSEEIFPEYYLELFKTTEMGTIFRVNSRGLGTGSSGFMRLYNEDFGDIKVMIPSKVEQKEISEFNENIKNKIKNAIECKQKEIEKLKEYKAVLINSAVTGKIKVCGNSQNAEMKTNYAKSNE